MKYERLLQAQEGRLLLLLVQDSLQGNYTLALKIRKMKGSVYRLYILLRAGFYSYTCGFLAFSKSELRA
jgi:hypothetical protein